jgi:WD40 repeat protein
MLAGGLPGGLSVAAQESEFRVEKVFEYRPPNWKRNDVAYGVFDSPGDTIYYIHKATVRIINWKTGQEIDAVSYGRLPCESKYIAYVSWWYPLLNSKFILMGYCDSLYLVDRLSLQVTRQVSDRENEEMVAADILPDGKYGEVVAVSGAKREFRYRLYSVEGWELISDLPIPPTDKFLFGPDGKYFALMRSITDQNKHVIKCGVEMREVSSARVVSEWWVDARIESCPGGVFVPSEDYVLAGAGLGGITFWDARTGAVLRRIVDEEREILSSSFLPKENSWSVRSMTIPKTLPHMNRSSRSGILLQGKCSTRHQRNVGRFSSVLGGGRIWIWLSQRMGNTSW